MSFTDKRSSFRTAIATALWLVSQAARAQAPAATEAEQGTPGVGVEKEKAASEPSAAAARTQAQENKVAESEDRVALAKSGRLLKYGVTAGAALTAQLPFAAKSGVRMETATIAVTPYLGILPAYWTANEERATYCSTTGLFQDGEQARRAATAISRKTAKIRLESMISWLRAVAAPENANASDVKTLLSAQLGNAPFGEDEIPELLLALRVLSEKQPDKRELAEQDAVNALAAARWAPELRARCGWYRLGFWVGRSFGYSADVSFDDVRVVRDVTPVVSFGALYVPNSYLTLMFGFAYNTVVPATTVTDPAVHRPVWTLSAGLGGTLDIATLLAKN